MKHAIFAYNYREAERHARESGLDHGKWIYADRRNKLEGLDPAQVITHQIDGWELNEGCFWAWEFYKQRCAMYGVPIGGSDND